jgi:hypothetical protein
MSTCVFADLRRLCQKWIRFHGTPARAADRHDRYLTGVRLRLDLLPGEIQTSAAGLLTTDQAKTRPFPCRA